MEERKYIVRRFTPLECGRLQGFPDGWGDSIHYETMDDADVNFWEAVRETYANVNGKAYKPMKDVEKLIKWVNGLHNDGAEYKMWGNGIALPCASYVMSGIIEELEEENEDGDG